MHLYTTSFNLFFIRCKKLLHSKLLAVKGGFLCTNVKVLVCIWFFNFRVVRVLVLETQIVYHISQNKRSIKIQNESDRSLNSCSQKIHAQKKFYIISFHFSSKLLNPVHAQFLKLYPFYVRSHKILPIYHSNSRKIG